ncbi:MAG TPA: right-handed parallel beta-helix repeat-containing protein [Anaerolineaceae bacterium]|nr:right-handed parallel beta-helix repeat-containing protein [Anaerolineaceae bacterium]
MKTISKIFVIVVILGFVFGLVSAREAKASTLDVCASGCTYSTIQDAVNVAVSGDVISIRAGSYEGFSIVGKSNITISGAGKGQTLIEPTSLINTGVGHKYVTPTLASVFVNQSNNVTIEGLTVKSTSATPGSGGADAIVFWNASTGTITDCSIEGIYTISGNQTGQGLAVDAGAGETTSLALVNTDISGAQKNAIDVVDGKASTPNAGTISLSITGGSFTGAGPTSVNAQNGIMAWNRGGGSIDLSVSGATISGFDYTPTNNEATGILVYGVGGGTVSVSGNTLTGNEINIYDNTSSLDMDAIFTANTFGPVALIPGGNSILGTIQGAINEATDGDTINIYGTHVLSSMVNVDKAVTLSCDPGALIQVSGTGDRFDFSADGASLVGCQIEKTDKTGEQNIIRIRASDITIQNNKIWGRYVIGDGDVSRAMIINSGVFTDLLIDQNEIYDLRQPAYISGTHSGTISHNYVHNTRGWVLEGGNLTFSNNTWAGNVLDVAILSAMPAAYYPDIVAMSNANNGAVIEDQRHSPALLSVVYVDDDAPAGGNGGQEAPYQTIQEGVNRVTPGGTVHVADGSYYPPAVINVNKAMSILGPASGEAKVYGVGGSTVKVFEITSSDVTISKLTITLANAPSAHIGMINVPDGPRSNINITDNKIYVDPQPGAMSTWYGQAVYLGRYITGSNVSGNTIYNTRGGIVVHYNSALTISNNVIYNTKGGIMNYTGTQADADARVMTGNSWNGIHNEWDIVWNSGGGPYAMDMNKSVLQVSQANNDGYTISLMTTGSIDNRSHVFVDDDSSFATAHKSRGNFNEPFKYMQLGIDAVVPGGTVYVAAGNYNEAVTANKALKLIGAGKETTIVDGTGLSNATLFRSAGLTSGVLDISGFTFKDDPDPNAAMTYLVSFGGCQSPAAVSFTDNTVLGTGDTDKDWGLLAQHGTCSFTINDNLFDNIGGNSIMVENSTGAVEIGDNEFLVPNDGGPAIWSMAYGSSLVPNTVTGLHWYHDNYIHPKAAGGSIWSGITIAPAWGSGWNVRQYGSYTNALIEKNKVEGFQSVGIQVEVDGTNSTFNGVIQNNTLTATPGVSSSKGIRLLGPVSDTTLRKNIVTNAHRGIWLSGTWGQPVYPTGITSEKNQLADNDIGYEEQDTASDQNASPNWWGSASGPAAGYVVSNLKYAPWCTNPECTAFYGPVHNVTQDTYFGSIQAAIDDAATVDGDVITVEAGTYEEQLSIEKSIDLRGPNYGVSAGVAPGVRVPEAVIVFPAGLTDYQEMIFIDAENVKVDGFTLDGQALAEDVDIAGIVSEEKNLTVKNNIIKNFNYIGILSSSYEFVGGSWDRTFYNTGLLIENNLVTNEVPGRYYNYSAIYVQGDNGVVRGNVVDKAYRGIQIQPYGNPETAQGLVENNEVRGYRTGIWFNYSEAPEVNWLIKGNKSVGIPAPATDPVTEWDGLLVQAFYAGNVAFEDNTVQLGATNAPNAYMFKKLAHTGGTIDLEATLANNDWEKVVVVRDSLGNIEETTIPSVTDRETTFFSSIQSAIDDVYTGTGDTVDVPAGTYVENVVVNKSVTIDGAGAGTIVMPAVSNPGVGLPGSLGGSNVFLVKAHNVKITDLVIDGDNPALVSGVVVGGADLDARNGIITDHTAGVFTGLEVSYVTVKNIYFRGIYASSASSGATFNIHHNNVSNTQGTGQSFAIMVYNGTGTVADNVIDYGKAVGANYSQGTQWLRNTLTHTPGGIHTDNAGFPNILGPEVISGNNVDCDNQASGYGIWTFVNRMPITVENNTVTGCGVAYSAWGSGNTSVATFQNNSATAPVPNNNSVGAYITTSGLGWGYYDVNANFTGNTFTGFASGVVLSAGPASWEPSPYVAKTITSDIKRNNIVGSTQYAVYQGAQGIYAANLKENWWGSLLGPQAPITDNVDVIQWCGTANPTCLPLMPQNGNNLSLSGTVNLETNGLYVPGITYLLLDGTTIQNTDEACFNVFADHISIMAESKLGAKCVPAAGKNGVNVAAGLQDVNIANLEFDGSAGGVSGVLFSGVVDYLTILDNWFHGLTGDAIEFQDQPTGIISIQGNLFQENDGRGIQSYGAIIPAEFNAWGDIDGPVAGDGVSTGVDADPWTHVDLYLYSTSPASIGGQVTYTVYGNLANVMGAGFTLAYPAAKLQLVPASLTNLSGFVEVAPGAGVFDTSTAGEIRFTGKVPAATPISGKSLPIYSVTFTVLGDDALLDLVEAGAEFTMAPVTADPTWNPAYSTNIYHMGFLDALVTTNSYTVQGTLTMEYRYMNVRSGIPGTLTGGTYGLYMANSVQPIPYNMKFLNVAPGTYTFTTNQPRYLNITEDLAKTITVVSSNVTFSTPLTLIAGNANWSDNVIDIVDASLLGNKYGWDVSTQGDTDADVDFSLKVGLSDLAIVGSNYGKSSAVNYTWMP